jgi:predicted transcriptional regulator of viral defense system
LGSRAAIDKALQRMVAAGTLRRIDRGLYDRPTTNRLTRRATVPDYRQVLDALSRRDRIRMLVDGMTAANDLGFTDAVPARVTIHTDARRRDIRLDNLVITFRQTAPSRLYWADRPAMRVVQALHWLKDTLPRNGNTVASRLAAILGDARNGPAIADDLRQGFSALPAWMQDFLRGVPGFDLQSPPPAEKAARRKPKAAKPAP